MAILYADIRKSTEYVRTHSPAEVARRVNRFLDISTEAITERDGFLLAFYGDCVLANWPPGFSGAAYVSKAVEAGRSMAEASRVAGIPVGIGVHAGSAYMCSVRAQRGSFRDVSVFGEAVNTVARLSDSAEACELLLSRAAAAAVGIDGPWESLAIEGFDQPVEVHRIET